MNTNLFIGGIAWAATEDQLREAFEQAGEVKSAKIITDRETGRSRGFGFVEMGSVDEAQAAIDMWNDKEFEGRTIAVSPAQPKEQ